MKKIIFVIPLLIFNAVAIAQITGQPSIDPGVLTTYNFFPQNLDYNSPVDWSVTPGAAITSHTLLQCKITGNNQSASLCNIYLKVSYNYLSSDYTTSIHTSQTLSIERFGFMTGPQSVYAGQTCTYTLADPCHHPFLCSYNWSNTMGADNFPAIVAWHLNNVSVKWPAALSANAISNGIIGYVRCTENCSGYSVMTHDYPVKVTLPGLGMITGPHSTVRYSHAPLTYTVVPLPGTPTNCSFQWTIPQGWTGSSTTNTITVIPNGSSAGTISVRSHMSSVLNSAPSTGTIVLVQAPDIRKKIQKVNTSLHD